MKQARFLIFFNDRVHFRRFLYGMAVLACLTGFGIIFIPQAWAASFSCSGGTPTGNLFSQDSISSTIYDKLGSSYTVTVPTSNGNGDPTGAAGACQANLGIFGSILCFFKASVGQIISSMYCGFQAALNGPLTIAIELFLAVSGIAILTGMTNFTAREGIIVLLKIAVIWAFAMNADWGIGIAYSFFMGLAEQGTNIILGSVSGGGSSHSGGEYLTQIDKIFQNVANMTSSVSAVGTNIFGVNVGIGAGQVPPQCLAWIFPFLLLLFLYFPLVAGFIFGLITQYVMLYARALLGYLTSIVLIGFLFVLSPLFIAFALFQTTRKLFDQWLAYLTSFSLQMIFVFAFMVLLDLIPIGDFFTEILSLLRADDSSIQQANYLNPTAFCQICDYTINYAASLGDTPAPITCNVASDSNPAKWNPLKTLYTKPDLFQTIIAQIIALWIIGEIMHDFLKKAPTIARDLAGRMQFAAVLGGGAESGGVAMDYLGLNSLEAKFAEWKQGISGSQAFRGNFMGRALPVLGAVAGVELLNRSIAQRIKNQSAGTQGGESDAQAGAGTGVAADTSGATRSASKTVLGAANASSPATSSLTRNIVRNEIYSVDKSKDAAKDDKSKLVSKGVLRMPLINMRNFDFMATEMKQVADRDDMNESYDTVQRALHSLETAKKNGDIELVKGAKDELLKAKQQYLDSTATLYETQQDLLRENLGLQPKKAYLPEEKNLFDMPDLKTLEQEEERAVEHYAEHMNNAMSSAQELQGKLTPQDSRKLIDDAAKSLQMQINVQGQLATPEDAAKSQALLDQALSDLAQTHAEDGVGMEKVLQQLYILQRSLT